MAWSLSFSWLMLRSRKRAGSRIPVFSLLASSDAISALPSCVRPAVTCPLASVLTFT